MSVLLDVPLIRQEAFTTCWFAAGRMVKGYGIAPGRERERFLQQTSNVQRFERVYTTYTNDKDWMFAKVMQGKRYAKKDPATLAQHNTFLSAEQRVMAHHTSQSQGMPPGEGLHFYFDGELDRYLQAEGLAKLTESSSEFLGEIVQTPETEVTTQFKSKIFLSAQFARLEKELRARGPLMVSLSLPVSGISHAHVITGVLRTPPEQTYENRFDLGEFISYKNFREAVTRTETSAPFGYWVFLNDPSGSAYQIKELDLQSRQSIDAKERKDLRAERYPISLYQLMLQMLSDYSSNKCFTEPKQPRDGQTCNMPMVYAPANAKLQRHLPLPNECADKGSRFFFF